jgi:galactokinase
MGTIDVETTREFFADTFGGEPDVVGSAPGRVNLIGEHTDYNGGQVLPLAIDRRTWVAMRAADGDSSRIVSDNRSAPAQFDARAIERSGEWWDYMTGVFAALGSNGIQLPQVEAVVVSDLPTGSGLSSSAALEVATAIAVARLVGYTRSIRDLALMSWRVETQFVGVASGVMDQFASALGERGHALHLWCDTLDTEQVKMSEAVLIFDTNLPRSLRGSQFNQRQHECAEALRLLRQRNPKLANLASATAEEVRAAGLPRTLEKRALHVSEENRRVERLVDVLRTSGLVAGDLLYESHESLRTLYDCSTPELDWFVDKAKMIDGVRGARLTGAGWGGCAIAVGEVDALNAARPALVDDYRASFGIEARTWLTHAERGAGVESDSRGAEVESDERGADAESDTRRAEAERGTSAGRAESERR